MSGNNQAAAALEAGARNAAAFFDAVDTMQAHSSVSPLIKRLVSLVFQGMELERGGYELQIPGDAPHSPAEIAAAFVENKADEVFDAVSHEVAFMVELIAALPIHGGIAAPHGKELQS